VGAGLGLALGTLTPALSQREREEVEAALSQRERGRRCGAGPSGRVADGQRRDGGAERVIRRKHPVIPVPVLARRRHEIGEPIEKLPRREINDAILPRASGRALPAGADPLAALVSGQRVADAFGAAVTARVQ
jgi:hypothetical protein